jgi:hypothetical protein
MWATIRGRVAREMREQAWPERVSARMDQTRWEMPSQDAIALLLNLTDPDCLDGRHERDKHAMKCVARVPQGYR